MARWRTLWSDPSLRTRAYLSAVITAGLAALAAAVVTKQTYAASPCKPSR